MSEKWQPKRAAKQRTEKEMGLARIEIVGITQALHAFIFDLASKNGHGRYLSEGNVWLLRRLAEDVFDRQYPQVPVDKRSEEVRNGLVDMARVLLTDPQDLKEPSGTTVNVRGNGDLAERMENAAGCELIEGNDEMGFRVELQEQIDELGGEVDVKNLPGEKYISVKARLQKR